MPYISACDNWCHIIRLYVKLLSCQKSVWGVQAEVCAENLQDGHKHPCPEKYFIPKSPRNIDLHFQHKILLILRTMLLWCCSVECETHERKEFWTKRQAGIAYQKQMRGSCWIHALHCHSHVLSTFCLHNDKHRLLLQIRSKPLLGAAVFSVVLYM